MKTPRKHIALRVLVMAPIAGIALTSCGSDPQDPETIMQEYIEHLNDEDFESALGLVHDPGDITADQIVKVQDVSSEELQADVDAFNDEGTNQSIRFSVGEESFDVPFTKQEDRWMLQEPALLSNEVSVLRGNGLALSEAVVTTEDGTQLSEGDRVIAFSDMEIDLIADFQGSDFAEPQEIPATGNFSRDDSATIGAKNVDNVELTITGEFHSLMEEEFENADTLKFMHYDVNIVEFPPKDSCDTESSQLAMTSNNGSFKVLCSNDEANIEVTSLDTGWDNVTERASGVFVTEVSGGHISDVRIGNVSIE